MIIGFKSGLIVSQRGPFHAVELSRGRRAEEVNTTGRTIYGVFVAKLGISMDRYNQKISSQK